MNPTGVEILPFKHVTGSSVDYGGRVLLRHLGKQKPRDGTGLTKVIQPVRSKINSKVEDL